MTPIGWGIVVFVIVGCFIAWCCCAMAGKCSDEERRNDETPRED